MSAYPLEIQASLLEEAEKLASKKDISLSQWIESMIQAEIEAEKGRERIEKYARKADYAKFDAIMARVPDVPPMEGDEILD
ncbi:MAG: CopG family transcriptional regulator [Cyanobacteria bacterium J06623_4]